MLLIPDPGIPAAWQKTTNDLFPIQVVASQHSKRITMRTFGETVYDCRIEARS